MGSMCAKQPVLDRVLLALLLLCYGVGYAYCSTVHENSGDLQSLLDFKQRITSDPNGVLSSWNISTHYCRWRGVACTPKRPWRVSGLTLNGTSIGGKITPSLANLTFLSILDLSSNLLVGQLPHLNGHQQLDTIYLYNNSLDGTIPESLTNCSKLRDLELYSNQLQGAIPRNIEALSNLEVLDLSYNNLIGIIPPTFPNLTKLYYVNLVSNQQEGSIPDGLWRSSNLQYLMLGLNSLTGEIPRSINMSRLQLLGVEFNKLNKALPSNIGIVLPSLQILSMSGNKFDGQIPASLGNASELQLIYLTNNSFTGQVPAIWGKLSQLTRLNLEINKLEAGDSQSWEFLGALTNCSSLKLLSLYNNRLRGVLPSSIGSLSTTIQQLLFGKNNISGVVPPSIGNLHSLIKLDLGDNILGGEIGEWVGKLKNVTGLFLGGNNFTGPIPSSIGNLTWLTELFLQRNEFEGFVPSSIGNLSQLSILDLSYNNIQGNIPQWVGDLKQLTELHLSSNKLTGQIPDTLEQCQNLVTIQLDQNFLTGDIPVSFGNLKCLNILNLSYNNLSGTIPTTLDNLLLLSELDLSNNHLQGEIPRNGIFRNATAVSLGGNWGLCGGVMDLHMPLCPAISLKIKKMHNLVRLLIPVFGFMSILMLIYIIVYGKKTPRRTYLLLFSFGKQFPKVSYDDLARATGNFSEEHLIGRGSYGSIYRGKLAPAKIQVAIKVFDLEMRCADKSFLLECEVLRTIRHRNLLSVLTACSTIDNRGNEFKALVYDLMHNGNLDIWLHHGCAGVGRNILSLAQRVSIAVNIADALVYLHHDCGRPIVHCDVKPTNILLDEDMSAHLGDFGIANLILDYPSTSDRNSGRNSSISVKGTIGYIAPEYAQSVHASTSGDVYSFGVVLLEMLIGKRPTDSMFENELTITNFVERNFPDHILHIIDVHLQEECNGFIHATRKTENATVCLVSLAQVALSCTCLIPTERMNMREVAIRLHAIQTSYVQAIKQEC